MKLRLQENPREWRKNALLTAGGVAMLSTILRWRRVVPNSLWLALLAAALAASVCAAAAPQWFRGYYRLSHRIGFHLAQAVGIAILSLFFVFVITPMGLLLRLFGKDPLRLKQSKAEETYWQPAAKNSPLDRMF